MKLSYVFLGVLELDFVQGVVTIYLIKVLKMGHPLPVLQIVAKILNL
jgi:hypothetical protein